jgi:hypothetical protein
VVFPAQAFLSNFSRFHDCYIPRPSHTPSFILCNNILVKNTNYKIFYGVLQSLLTFSLLSQNILTSTLSQISSLYVLSQCNKPNSTHVQKQVQL